MYTVYVPNKTLVPKEEENTYTQRNVTKTSLQPSAIPRNRNQVKGYIPRAVSSIYFATFCRYSAPRAYSVNWLYLRYQLLGITVTVKSIFLNLHTYAVKWPILVVYWQCALRESLFDMIEIYSAMIVYLLGYLGDRLW